MKKRFVFCMLYVLTLLLLSACAKQDLSCPFALATPPVRERTGGKQVEKKKSLCPFRKQSQAARKNCLKDVYRFHGKETIGDKTPEYVEEIELTPGEDGITAEDIKKLYTAEDSEVYYNLRSPLKTSTTR